MDAEHWWRLALLALLIPLTRSKAARTWTQAHRELVVPGVLLLLAAVVVAALAP